MKRMLNEPVPDDYVRMVIWVMCFCVYAYMAGTIIEKIGS